MLKKLKYFLLALFLVQILPLTIFAQQTCSYTYSVKFVCGEPEEKILVPGAYLTAINVHNPSDRDCVFKKRFSIALPNQKPGPVSEWLPNKTLKTGEAMEIDCPEIFKICYDMGYKASLLKGFVQIKSNIKLNIVAVYSAAGKTGQVETLHVEKFSPIYVDCNHDSSTEVCECEPIPKSGKQCLIRVSKKSGLDYINVSREYIYAYKCDGEETQKFRTKAKFTLFSNSACDEKPNMIPDESLLQAEGYEILRPDSTAIFTGEFKLYNPNQQEIGEGYITIISKIGTHHYPISGKPECEPCAPFRHSEGYLCGNLKYHNQTYQLWFQIAVNYWLEKEPAPIAVFEGVVVR